MWQTPEIRRFAERVKGMVEPERYAHVLRVATLTERIGRANAFSRAELMSAALAAVLHDAARDLADAELFALTAPANQVERRHPLSVHGRAARILATRWGVSDPEVLDAIEGHVFGVSHDNRVGMAVYIADVSEPARGVNQDIRELAMRNLFRAYQRAVDSKVRYLRSRGKQVHPRTLEIYRELCDLT